MDGSRFLALAWLSTFANAGAAAAIFALCMHRNRQWPAALPWAAVGAGIVFAASAMISITLGCGFFGLVMLAYLAIAVAPPTLGLCLLADSRLRRRSRARRPAAPAAFADAPAQSGQTSPPRSTPASSLCRNIIAVVLLTPPLVCAYASFIAPYQLVLERADVPLPQLDASILPSPIRVGVLADLQTDRVGDHERGAVNLLMEQSPDLLLLPGDYFQVSTARMNEHWGEFRDLLSGLKALAGCFAVLGDVDRPGQTARLMAEAGIRLLVNDIATTDIRGLRVAIAGVELHCTSASARETIRRLSETPADVRILLSHRPDAVLATGPGDRVDLVVAGHTHGGQVVIPGFGPPITLSRVPRHIAAGGLGQVNGHRIYVSRGVGFERGLAPPVRLFCPPEVTLLTLIPPNQRGESSR